jgi:hypothetical protein
MARSCSNGAGGTLRRDGGCAAVRYLLSKPAWSGASEFFEASYARIWEAIRALVKRAIKSGDIRKGLDPIDLLRALIGVANVATSPD